jgi:hypothetical protein
MHVPGAASKVDGAAMAPGSQVYRHGECYEFETPIPEITREGAKPFRPTGYRTLNARTWFFYGITGITPAMAMRLPGVGSAYLIAWQNADKQYSTVPRPRSRSTTTREPCGGGECQSTPIER